MNITFNWLRKMKFGVSRGKKYKVYYMNGLHLAYWENIGWRWQIGGTENMWEPMHNPSREFVLSVLSNLRGQDCQLQ